MIVAQAHCPRLQQVRQEMEMTTATAPTTLDRHWPAEGVTRVPFWAYSDSQVYEQEMSRIFCGESWAYVGLEVEIPQPGDFKQVTIGDRLVVLVRDEAGAVHVFVNRCAHRGVKFCRVPSGNVQRFTCPYHQWTYDLQGRLRGVPFHRGLRHQGGMPADFSREAYGLEALQVTIRHGAVFASFSAQVEPFEDYLGPTIHHHTLFSAKW
jgi:phenylpropionate dioxygenase-like ring-hydroxylating dioxygenase large terminal subunit